MTRADETEGLGGVLLELMAHFHRKAAAKFTADEAQAIVGELLQDAAAQRWVAQQMEETSLKSMDFRNGASMSLQPAREMAAMWVGACRGLLQDAPNYSETKLEMDVKVAESPETYTVVIQRHDPGKLTPHEARVRAEEEKRQILRLLVEFWHAGEDVDSLVQALMRNGVEIHL